MMAISVASFAAVSTPSFLKSMNEFFFAFLRRKSDESSQLIHKNAL
jgi:hypothetical protein